MRHGSHGIYAHEDKWFVKARELLIVVGFWVFSGLFYDFEAEFEVKVTLSFCKDILPSLHLHLARLGKKNQECKLGEGQVCKNCAEKEWKEILFKEAYLLSCK